MKYAGYLGASEADERKINWYRDNEIMGDPLPPVEDWRAPRLVQYLGDGKRKRKPAKIGDAPSSGVALISQRAREALEDIWQRDCLLYPVKLDDSEDPFYMIVARHEIDCLDRTRSIGKKQKYGSTPELFAIVEEWVFDESAVGEHDLFRLPDSRATLYVTERFKQRVIEAGLRGFCLKRAFWEEDPFIS